MKANEYLLTIDAGTGSGRAVLFDALGHQIGLGQEEWTHLSEEGVPNSMSFDYTNNWQLIIRCIKKAIAGIDPKQIKAVTSTSMREGIVLYDHNGEELFAVANVDARADTEVAYLNSAFPTLEKECYAISGQTFALGALPRLLWVKNNHPEIYERTTTISMISDWVLAKLSGEIAVDPSNAGTSGIFNLKTRQWEKTMATKVGLKDDIFPPVYESGEVYAEVSKKASAETGLNTDTKIVMGGGDVQLGSAGLGVVKSGECAILGGTFWQQLVNMDEVKIDSNMDIRINPHVIPGISQAEGISFFSGMVMRWFRDTFCEKLIDKAKRKDIDPYVLLEEMASKVPVGSHGVLPIFSDVMRYGKWYHAAPSFLNLSLDPTKSGKAVLFRSLEENAAIVSMLNLESIFRFTNTQSDSITFAGGASKGALWSQILADVTGKRVCIPEVTEATALGGAFVAGVGAGLYDSTAQIAKELVVWDKEIEPNMQNYAKYQDVAQKWQEAYKMQLTLVDKGITTSMWKAPGL
jgi:autoinducer-2 kinase